MWVIRGAVSEMPYYGGETNTPGGIIYHWVSNTDYAKKYKNGLKAFIVAKRLVYNGVTSHTTLERIKN